ncbi:MAG: ion transporter [Lachnospiraceae bacterium]|nr:ion transporter [Lachnospiraceae bacterium]
MKPIKKLVEKPIFNNFILIVILINSVVMGLQTSPKLEASIGNILGIIDLVCLGIFTIEIILKLMAYGVRFFTDGWNIFDFVIVLLSFVTGLSFLSTLRAFRVFRVLRTLKAVKGLRALRALRLVSWLDKLKMIISAIAHSIPGILWSGLLLMLIYYIFSIMGVTLFGAAFPDWFGNIGKAMYTLFQVMTLESWSMGISRPVMEVFNWAWAYFVPFVLISSFIMMNVIVGIVVNAISEVSEIKKKEDEEEEKELSKEDELRKEIRALKEQLTKVEKMLDEE